jgi:hypothetical protein
MIILCIIAVASLGAGYYIASLIWPVSGKSILRRN